MRCFVFILGMIIAGVSLGAEANYPYAVRKGEIRVFGYSLRSGEIRAVEDEYQVSFSESPDNKRVLIVYDEPFEKGAVWLYDKTISTGPQLVKTERLGRHFGVDWYGNRAFSVFGAGMGYKTSRLFTVGDIKHFKELVDVVEFDPERDIYARLESDKDFKYFIVLGRAFHSDVKEDRIPISLYDQDAVGAIAYVDKAVFTSNAVVITYTNKDEKVTTETIRSKVVESAKH